ncbi:hypothetical protein BgiMline_009298 [Biomphalaria glabrata]|nr:CAunnamed protein product [Biomphalaria glabrata]KAI8784887.1 CAunnamed protein product [Biomphalaria glabrata]
MTFASSIRSSTILLKVVLSIVLVSFILAWISFVTASWGDGYSGNSLLGYGLWRRCNDIETNPACVNIEGWNLHWYRAVQAFAIFGFVSVNFCLFFVLLLMFVESCSKGRSLSLWVSVLGFWSALSYAVAIIVFAGSFDSSFTDAASPNQHLEYGWGLAIVVAVLQIFVGALMIFESRNTGAKFMDL